MIRFHEAPIFATRGISHHTPPGGRCARTLTDGIRLLTEAPLFSCAWRFSTRGTSIFIDGGPDLAEYAVGGDSLLDGVTVLKNVIQYRTDAASGHTSGLSGFDIGL